MSYGSQISQKTCRFSGPTAHKPSVLSMPLCLAPGPSWTQVPMQGAAEAANDSPKRFHDHAEALQR